MECTTIEEIIFQITIASQIIFFIAGILAKSLEQEKQVWGFRIVYFIMPAFFVAYYSQEFLFKDWSKK